MLYVVHRGNTISLARSMGVLIGAGCRVLDDPVDVFGSEPYLVSLGDRVTITVGVRFVTHDGGVWLFRKDDEDIDVFGAIAVGSNVFIGFNSIILPNVTIGDDCVIGAGSVVTKSLESGYVYAGVPAKAVRSVSEYKARCLARATRIRSLHPAKKRRYLSEKFRHG